MVKRLMSFSHLVEAVNERAGKITYFLILVIAAIVSLEVMSRYVFNHPIFWVWPVNRQVFGISILFAGSLFDTSLWLSPNSHEKSCSRGNTYAVYLAIRTSFCINSSDRSFSYNNISSNWIFGYPTKCSDDRRVIES